MRIPDGVSFEAAATVGVGVGTTGYALYKVLGLPFPSIGPERPTLQRDADSEKVILVYGGSTATGTIAIQFASL